MKELLKILTYDLYVKKTAFYKYVLLFHYVLLLI